MSAGQLLLRSFFDKYLVIEYGGFTFVTVSFITKFLEGRVCVCVCVCVKELQLPTHHPPPPHSCSPLGPSYSKF